jgi:hypothetical protein
VVTTLNHVVQSIDPTLGGGQTSSPSTPTTASPLTPPAQ